MVEEWLEAHIFFANNQANNASSILQEVVKFLADDLDAKNIRKTYHFLFEPRIDGNPGFEILFRIESSESVSLNEIEEEVIAKIHQYSHLNDGYRITKNYHGEADGFGQDGWELTKQFFEIGSKIAIGRLSPSFNKGDKFIPGKLIHCYLSQNSVNEEVFHAIELVGRVLINLHANAVTTEVEEKAKNRLEEALNKVKSSPIKMV